jgi:hypothetical protein
MTDAAEADRPTLVVFDLNNLNAKALTLIPKFKAKLKKSASIIGFLTVILCTRTGIRDTLTSPRHIHH